MAEESEGWRRCSSCKDWIAFEQAHYVCSVSTCNRKRTGLVFCSVSCWEVHVPMMRHRDSGAVEGRAPTREAHARAEREAREKDAAKGVRRESRPEQAAVSPPATSQSRSGERSASAPSAAFPEEASERVIGSEASPRAEGPVAKLDLSDDFPIDVLIVASKLKQYIKARSGMNTSDATLKVLSEHVRALCDGAIRSAAGNERKTVMDRDFSKPDRKL